jgi:serine/threonine protein kinase
VDPDRWRKIEALFQKAQELESGQRAVFLEEHCAGDESLRKEVESLLFHDKNAGQQFLQRAAAVKQPEAGQRVSRYEIQGKLGEGGMGAVYRANDGQLRRAVALKVLHPEYAADPKARDRLLREARAASALSHPNIVSIYEVGSDSGVDFIAMELVEGKTLDEMIPARGLPLKKALDYALQIAGGLAKAHASGVVHRDLKPGNIMVTRDGVVKMLDFGLARRVRLQPGHDTTLTAQGEIAGTPGYMAPEQLEGMPLDARSDIFSYGVVLYEMLTGRKAFAGESAAAVMAAVLREEPEPLGDKAPNELEKIVQRCLRKDPDRRWQTMADLRVALRDLYEERDAQPAGDAAQPPNPSRNRRWLLAGAVSLLLVAAAGWLFVKHVHLKSPPPALTQLTSYHGFVVMPSFSPDGNQVAFSWNGPEEDNYNIYVKIVGETNALRLTTDQTPEFWPAWSPDGKRIAFQRNRPGAPGIWSVSPLGGAEQKLADLGAAGQMSWSPDGKWLAVARGTGDDVVDGNGILLVPANGGDPRRISNPKAPAYDMYPSFSPNKQELAYASCTSWSCDIFVQPLDSAYSPRERPRRITRQGILIAGLAWTRDGGSLVYSGALSWGMFRLWRVGSSGKQQPERLDLAGFQSRFPSIASTADRLAFTRWATDFDVWRFQPGGVPEPFLRSSLHDYSPEFSPNGSRIAFTSGRSGDALEIWTADADGSHLVQLTTAIGRAQGSPRWSPDGRLIAFDSLNQKGRSLIYVVDSNGGTPRCVSSGMSNDALPSWSRDGKWIYFASNRTHRYEVWRVPMAGGQAQQITEDGGFLAFESVDGRTLFYTKAAGPSLFARSSDGGPERKVLDSLYENFTPVEDGIYYIGQPGPDRKYPIQFYEFATGASCLLTRVEGPLDWGLSVSPDRKTILYSKSATTGSYLMMIENFR